MLENEDCKIVNVITCLEINKKNTQFLFILSFVYEDAAAIQKCYDHSNST